MNYQQRIVYIVILAIVIVVFFYYNKSVISEGLAPSTDTTDDGNAYIENKALTGEITDSTTHSKMSDVTSKIKECQNIINEINQVLPRSIDDIKIDSVSQTEDLDQIGFTIIPGVKQTLNPITNVNESTGTWTINAVLPRGKPGPSGLKGPKGNTGMHGPVGNEGQIGRQGPWGKDCSNNKCN